MAIGDDLPLIYDIYVRTLTQVQTSIICVNVRT